MKFQEIFFQQIPKKYSQKMGSLVFLSLLKFMKSKCSQFFLATFSCPCFYCFQKWALYDLFSESYSHFKYLSDFCPTHIVPSCIVPSIWILKPLPGFQKLQLTWTLQYPIRTLISPDSADFGDFLRYPSQYHMLCLITHERIVETKNCITVDPAVVDSYSENPQM